MGRAASCRSGQGNARWANGFALLSALWLLLLIGTIAAFLLARSMRLSMEVAEDSRQVQAGYALDAALETVMADLLFNGPRSNWSRLPAIGSITINKADTNVRITSETGRLDVNVVEPQLLDDALRGFGIGPRQRTQLVEQIQRARAGGGQIASMAELAAMGATVRDAVPPCLLENLTIFSGLSVPRPDRMPERLREALRKTGRVAAGAGEGSGPVTAGEPIRVELRGADGAALVAVVRLTGAIDRPYLVHWWLPHAVCAR